jgi:phosphatidylserine/phosphatidylglycerophosphate/cardiolipin synthase-like enzyme
MKHTTIAEKYWEFISKVKSHPIVAGVCVALVICFVLWAYTHPLQAPYSQISRVGLPTLNVPAGTFTLITEPAEGTAPVLSMINNAKSSVDLVMYEFQDKQIADALIADQKRGVAVRVLVDQGYFGKEEKINEPSYAYLASSGVAVHWAPNYFALTHQKTLIVDGREVLIMTFNFSPQYYATGRDFGVVDTDVNDVGAIKNTFTADWNNQKILPSNGDDLVWSPNSAPDMLLIINSAKKELDIYNEEMKDGRIISALIGAEQRGVAVKVVMTYATAWKLAFQELKSAGVELHLFHGEKGTYIHAKVIVADGSYAFLGSENFSYTSLDQNRELGIFLSDPTVINSLASTFSTDWQNAKEY